MKGVRNQAYDQIYLRNFSIQGFLVCDVEGDRVGIFDPFRELRGTGKSSTS
jgi:hypothetical protein